jgi:hypothetical protein
LFVTEESVVMLIVTRTIFSSIAQGRTGGKQEGSQRLPIYLARRGTVLVKKSRGWIGLRNELEIQLFQVLN